LEVNQPLSASFNKRNPKKQISSTTLAALDEAKIPGYSCEKPNSPGYHRHTL